jgi:Domain of unknown function (DUF4491)
MNLFGPALGIVTLLVIGLGFVWVVRVERRLGYLWWPYFLAAGILLLGASLFIASDWGSALAGVAGASLAWGATELKVQALRAELGWYPYQGKKRRPPLAERIARWKAPNL